MSGNTDGVLGRDRYEQWSGVAERVVLVALFPPSTIMVHGIGVLTCEGVHAPGMYVCVHPHACDFMFSTQDVSLSAAETTKCF